MLVLLSLFIWSIIFFVDAETAVEIPIKQNET
jgi:hypothetical protein